jgi:peptide/nickel transport system permease protein
MTMDTELRFFLHFCRSTPSFVLGLAIVLLSLVLMVLGPHLAPFPPERTIEGAILLPPGGIHLFGTDANGLDIFSRVITAPRIDIYIGFVSTVIALAVGVPLGVVTGFFSASDGVGRLLSEWLMRALDVIQAFPVFILALALVAAMGASETNIIIVLVVLQAPVFLRLTRATAMSVRNALYVEAARCSGASEWQILFVHMLPNSMSPALIASSVAVGQAILITAGLSFVGAGVEVTTAEWGAMISQGARNMVTGQWWPSVFPGLALGLTVYGYAVVGDGLRRYLDPTKR